MSIIEAFFNIFAPYECLCCKREGSLLCDACVGTLERTPPRCYVCKRWEEDFRTCSECRADSPLFSVRSVTAYEGVAKELVRVLKFGRAKGAAGSIAQSLASVTDGVEEVYITHIPTANTRVRERGYDQAALIARELSKQSGQPYAPLLARVGVQRQLGKGRDARKQQMGGAFRALDPRMLNGKHVLLIDDVLTTGATCESAARVLRQAGAKTVSVAVFAVA